MIIDGFIPADPKIALEQGVTFHYPTEYGDVTITSKSLNPDDNPRAKVALRSYGEWQTRRQRLNKTGADVEADKRFMGILYDEGVIDWSTTAKSEGKEITPTRENFIDLLLTPAFRAVGALYAEDAMESKNFRALSTEDAAKNSETSSAGNSGGGAMATETPASAS